MVKYHKNKTGPKEKIVIQLLQACDAMYENERLCKASAETKFTWAMPSRRQRCIYMNVFVKPNEQSSSSLEYSAMARIFV